MPLKPETPISESAGNQDIPNFEQEEHSLRRMEMSPGAVRVEQRLKQRGNWRAAVPQPVLFPFPSTGLGATEFRLEEIRSHDEGSLGQADSLD